MEKLSIKFIQKNLDNSLVGKNIIYFEEIDSTNDYAAKLIKDKKTVNTASDINGTVIISETQTKGKGRFDKIWISPQGGLWFSIILKPQIESNDLSKITLVGAASIVEVLINEYFEGMQCKDLNIKWPNDIYYKDKKLAGILAESEKINDKFYLILGIGLNVNCSIKNNSSGNMENIKAISLKDILETQIDRNFLLLKILSAFEKNYIYFISTRDFKTIFNKIKKSLVLQIPRH
ncbi:MAG: biotin--[acetyl-CoA-carboxylase] ligase [Actinobacteria bacterium]|nr:biotin--[acetyl-CoA-carboxylase] ligase [Actinomycetota bacterium]